MKYVYSEKRKEVLAVEEGSPVYDAAVKKGMQLYDTKESAEEAVGVAMEAVHGLADGYRIEGDKVKKVPGSEVQGRLDKGEAVYSSEEEANAASHRVGGEGTKEPAPKLRETAPKLRETALRYMDRVYKGDLKKTLDALAAGYSMDPLETTDEQRMFITAARRVAGARTDKEVLQALAVFPGLAERLDLEVRQKEWHGYAGGPPVKAILAPNLVNRKLSGSGTLSKVVGAAEDALSLVPRAIRAGIEETMPIADEMTFAERMAVPHELLTAPQAMFTEGLSSIAPGMVTEAAGRAGLRFAGRKIPAVSRFLQKQSQRTGATEDLTKAIRGVDDVLVLPKGRYVANQAAKGIGEGVAFSAHPAMLEATSPDDGAVGRGVFTAAVGTAMGPLGRAAYAVTPFGYKAAVRNMADDVLTPAGRELRNGLGPYERIGSALAADERVLEKGGVPRALAPESGSRLRSLTESVGDIRYARQGLDGKRFKLFSDFANDLPEQPKRPMDKDEINSFMFRAKQAGIPEEEASDLLARSKSELQVPYLEYPGKVYVPDLYAEGPLPAPITPEAPAYGYWGTEDLSTTDLFNKVADESLPWDERDFYLTMAFARTGKKYTPDVHLADIAPDHVMKGSALDRIRWALDNAYKGHLNGESVIPKKTKRMSESTYIARKNKAERMLQERMLQERSMFPAEELEAARRAVDSYNKAIVEQQRRDALGGHSDMLAEHGVPEERFPDTHRKAYIRGGSANGLKFPIGREPSDALLQPYGPGAPVLVEPRHMAESKDPPVQRYREESVVDPMDLAKLTAWHGVESKDPVRYLELAQPFSYYGTFGVELPSDRLRRIDALLAGLPAEGKEQSYLQKIGQSRLDRLTAIEPYREAVKLQQDINRELDEEFAWDIPAAVAAYRRSQRPTVSSPATGLVENMIAAKIAKAAPGAAVNVASGVGKSARVSAPAAGAEKSFKHRDIAGNVPQLIVIGKGGLLQAPFTPIKKFNSIDDMD